MLKLRAAPAAMFVAAIASPAAAAPKMVVQPVQMSDESIRYNHGVATIDQFSTGGSVQVRPATMDHGSLAFNIAVYNTGTQPLNIDVSNFTLISGDVTVGAQTSETLQRKAQSRAAWAQFAVALAGGLTAVAAANQRDTYRSTFVTPRGTYRSYYSAPSAFGQLQATAAIAGAGVGVASIQNQLDKTLEELGDQIVQITTVDPGESYAGTIVFEKVKLAKLPQQVTMVVDWAGQKYPFVFQLAKPGTPAPAFKPAAIDAAPAGEPPIAPEAAPMSLPTAVPAVLTMPADASAQVAVPIAAATASTPPSAIPVATPPPTAGLPEPKAAYSRPTPGCSALVPGSCGDGPHR